MNRKLALIFAALLSVSLFFTACSKAPADQDLGTDLPAFGDSADGADDPVLPPENADEGEKTDPAAPPAEGADSQTPPDKPSGSSGSQTPSGGQPSSGKPSGDSGSQAPAGGQPSSGKPSGDSGSQAPADKPSDSAGNEPAKPAVTVADLWSAVSGAMGEIPSLVDLDADTLSSLYSISSSDLDSYVAKMPMMNVKATEIFIAKAADGKMSTVKAAVLERQKALDEQWKHYLPDQYELVKNYQLVESGDYLLFVVGDNAAAAADAFRAALK